MEYLIFGDCHGCLDELKELLVKCGCQIENNKIKSKFQIISLGDYLDKGPQVRETIDFFYENDIKVVQANHEYWNIGYWDNMWDVEQSVKDQFFTSHNLEESYKEKVREIYSKSVPYFVGPNFIATHSPCHCKYLCKDDQISLKMQRNFRYTHLTEEEIVKWLNELPSNRCWPYHVFGHIALDTIYTRDNLIGLDTGCASGNYLSAVKIVEGHKPYFIKVKSRQPEGKVIKVRAEKVYSIEEQDPFTKRKVRALVSKGINFISGTMCPADRVDQELESIGWALNYYKENGIDEVTLSSKMMGSRGTVYLFKDVDQCYLVSRNGFRPKIDLQHEYSRLIERFKPLFQDGLYCRILDCELMPWRVLGAGLIDKSFYGYYELAFNESNICNQYGFDSVIQSIPKYLHDDFHILSKKEFIDKYKHHTYSFDKNGRSLLKLELNTDVHISDLNKFFYQCEKYGGDDKTTLYPFAILKDVYNTREELRIYDSHFDTFNEINDAKIWKINVQDTNLANDIYNENIKQYEGVVVRPNIYKDGIAPYLKVRNPEYLRLVYGYDYLQPLKYQKLLERKRINRKLRQSIEEYRLGIEMLKTPYNQLDTPKYYSLLIEFLLEDNVSVDPRL